MTCTAADQRPLRARRREERDVARHHDELERLPEIEGAEVVDSPVEVGREASRGGHHRCIGVDTDHRHASTSKLTSNSSGSAARVEDRSGREAHDEVGFTMDVNTLVSQRVELLLVLVAVPAHAPNLHGR